MRFLHKFADDQFVRNLVEELDCYIDTRRNRAFQEYGKTEEYQKIAAEIETLREQLSKFDPQLLEQYETALLEEGNYISTHEYLQGVLDGIALRSVFYDLHMR